MADVIKREKTFAEQIDDCLNGKIDERNSLKVCDTPSILLTIGCEQLPMLYTQKHLKDALHEKDPSNNHYHGISIELMKKIPELLNNPLMILDSASPSRKRDSIIVVLNAKDSDNAPLIVSVKPNGNGRYQLERINSNFITSIYGKDNGFSSFIQKAAEHDEILFWNKEKSQEMFSVLKLQLPQALNTLSSNTIIHQSRNIVNRSEEKNKENTQKDSLAYINEQSKPMIMYDRQHPRPANGLVLGQLGTGKAFVAEGNATQYDSLSIEEFMDKANTISKRALALDTTNMTADNISAENIKLIKEYFEVKQIMNDTCQAQKFLASSTQLFSNGEEIRLMSAMPASRYSEAARVLTNNIDREFMLICAKNDITEESLEKILVKMKEREVSFKAANRDEYAILKNQEQITVAQLLKVIEEMKAEQEKVYEQEKYLLEKQEEEKRYEEQKEAENKDPAVEEKMIKAMSDMMVAGALYEITSKAIKDIENGERFKKIGTAEKPAIIVKGGGYAAMPYVEQGKENTVAIENLLEADITADGEYVPATLDPIETTNDAAKAGGNVQLTTTHTGTIELKQEEAMPVSTNKSGKSTKLEIEM